MKRSIAMIAATTFVSFFWAANGCSAEPKAVAPTAAESHPPYFNFKARQFLIEGSHSIAPLQPVAVAHERQLMFDRQLIDDAWGCKRTVHQPTKYEKNPVLAGEPRFGKVHFGSSFLFDAEARKFRLWACSWNIARAEEDLGLFHAYYESDDLRKWTQPSLGLVDYDGSKANNVFHAAKGVEYHSASVVPAPQRMRNKGKYAMFYAVAFQPPQPGTRHGMEQRIAWSDDGYNWKDQPENPVFRGRSDTFNNIVYNAERDVFMMYRRSTVNANEIRRVAYSESKDLITWTQPETVLFPDEADAASMFYSMVVAPYHEMYLGFLQDFYLYSDNPASGAKARSGPKSHQLEIELAWSRDGRHWERHPRRPTFLPTGLPGSYDWGMVSLHQGLHEKDGTISLLYSGDEAFHIATQVKQGRGSNLCLATLRQDGFVSLDAPKEGYMLTKPIQLPGGRLHLNAQTEAGGFVRVALRSGDGERDGDWIQEWNFAECEQFQGDSVDAPVSWTTGKNLDSLKDQSIRLHFWLNRAKLYSFWFE